MVDPCGAGVRNRDEIGWSDCWGFEMKYLHAYDLYLKRLAQDGSKKSGIATIGLGPILLATIPFYVAIIIVTATFGTLGWTNPLATALKIFISVALLVALFHSGFRVVYHRAQSHKDK